MFQGVFTAIITPFKDDKIDYNSFFRILDAQIQSGVAGVVPCGTTGESPTLDYDEHSELIQKTVEYVNKRILVIAGTGSNSTSEAIKRLSDIPNIKSIKEATGDLGQMAKTIQAVGSKMSVLSGDDNLTLPLLAIGGKGVVSVVSNLFPKTLSSMVASFLKGDLEGARKIHYELLSVFSLVFCETNPIPVKAAMHWLGYSENTLRLPMTSLTASAQADELKKQIFHLRSLGYE